MSSWSSGNVRSLVVCLSVICALSATEPLANTQDSKDTWKAFPSTCSSEDTKNLSVSCHGVRIVRRVVQQILESTRKEHDIEIFNGVSLVEVPGSESSRRGRFLKGFGAAGPFLQFLEGRELRVKLPSLLPENLEAAFEQSLPSVSQGRGKGGGGFGGGKKGGGEGVLLMGLMMGKMMAALGMGALGMLSMKALMVSAMALMMSMIVAVKKLTSSGGDDSGHHVVYAQDVGGGGGHHHRRKRSPLGDEDDDDLLELPYRGYAGVYKGHRVSS